jgi:hypothetical protein
LEAFWSQKVSFRAASHLAGSTVMLHAFVIASEVEESLDTP